MEDPVAHLYQFLGEDTLRSMVAAFYRRIKTDDLIGPMYPADDWEGSEKRLGDFLVFRFGGPQTYLEERGHPRLRMRHMPFAIGEGARDRWLQLMNEAMEETHVAVEARPMLTSFFGMVAEAMRNRQ